MTKINKNAKKVVWKYSIAAKYELFAPGVRCVCCEVNVLRNPYNRYIDSMFFIVYFFDSKPYVSTRYLYMQRYFTGIP